MTSFPADTASCLCKVCHLNTFFYELNKNSYTAEDINLFFRGKKTTFYSLAAFVRLNIVLPL